VRAVGARGLRGRVFPALLAAGLPARPLRWGAAGRAAWACPRPWPAGLDGCSRGPLSREVEVLDETFGLGPLEPLMREASISDQAQIGNRTARRGPELQPPAGRTCKGGTAATGGTSRASVGTPRSGAAYDDPLARPGAAARRLRYCRRSRAERPTGRFPPPARTPACDPLPPTRSTGPAAEAAGSRSFRGRLPRQIAGVRQAARVSCPGRRGTRTPTAQRDELGRPSERVLS
jgi:hypothetical protein